MVLSLVLPLAVTSTPRSVVVCVTFEVSVSVVAPSVGPSVLVGQVETSAVSADGVVIEVLESGPVSVDAAVLVCGKEVVDVIGCAVEKGKVVVRSAGEEVVGAPTVVVLPSAGLDVEEATEPAAVVDQLLSPCLVLSASAVVVKFTSVVVLLKSLD